MSKNYKIYDLTVSTVTPLHIGTGKDLLHEYDYAVRDKKTWRINESALLDAQDVDDPRQADLLARTPPAQLLAPEDFKEESPFFRYIIQGTPRSVRPGAQLQEQIKTVNDTPYLPGSSLKGALRTAIAWYAWGEMNLKPRVDKLYDQRGRPLRSKFAAQNYEKDIFGKNSNHDFMRALHVSDSQSISQNALMVININVFNQKGVLQAPIEAEAIQRGIEFSTSIKIDLALYSKWAKRLRFKGENWLKDIPKIVQAHTQQHILSEKKWYQSISEKNRLAGFYAALERNIKKLSPSTFFLQLGAGTGWRNKTFGSRLLGKEDFMNKILRPKNQGGYGVARHGMPNNLKDFPLSRRVKDEPYQPLGWVLVEMKERG